MPRKSRRSRGVAVSSRMLKNAASIVLASFRPSTYPKGYASSGPSLAAASLDGIFEHPAWCAPLLHVWDKRRTLSQDSHTKHTRLAGKARQAESGFARLACRTRTDIFEILLTSRAKAPNRGSSKAPNRDLAPYNRGGYGGPRLLIRPKLAYA